MSDIDQAPFPRPMNVAASLAGRMRGLSEDMLHVASFDSRTSLLEFHDSGGWIHVFVGNEVIVTDSSGRCVRITGPCRNRLNIVPGSNIRRQSLLIARDITNLLELVASASPVSNDLLYMIDGTLAMKRELMFAFAAGANNMGQIEKLSRLTNKITHLQNVVEVNPDFMFVGKIGHGWILRRVWQANIGPVNECSLAMKVMIDRMLAGTEPARHNADIMSKIKAIVNLKVHFTPILIDYQHTFGEISENNTSREVELDNSQVHHRTFRRKPLMSATAAASLAMRLLASTGIASAQRKGAIISSPASGYVMTIPDVLAMVLATSSPTYTWVDGRRHEQSLSSLIMPNIIRMATHSV